MTIYKNIIAFVLSLTFAAGALAAPNKEVKGTQGYRDEILHPQPPKPWTGPPRTGAQVYAYRCAACHAKTTQGAPMPGDDVQWGMRYRQQGLKVLLSHTIDGYNNLLMPARGGCLNCSDAELKAALLFMLNESGIHPEKEKIQAGH